MNWNVLSAIFKRNFASYFSSPTGYVFIGVFVVLSSVAQFWSPEFFSSNLANLDPLSEYMPFILLVFIPAITMSLWAEERKEGTDELLLTIPASDMDVVLGKYLAAVAIFTVALLFSAFSIYLVFLWGLGYPDIGLFAGTFLGYWFLGIAMLAVGMVASFLTRNLTVAFILGMLFNFPLAVAGVADAIIDNHFLASTVRQWSAAEQLQDFERGVVSFSAVSYFLLIAAVGVYLSVVLIGRRHWRGGKDGDSMLGHYIARVAALVAIAAGVSVIFHYNDWLRADVTEDRLNSLSPDTVRLVQEVANRDDAHSIKIDIYASPQVPAAYVETKLNLLATADELASKSRGKIQVEKHLIETFSPEATRASETYGIEPREVMFRHQGRQTQDRILLGFAVSSGLDKVVVPFVDRGIPIEYELIRSIVTVAQDERQRLGIVKTDVPLLDPGFAMPGQAPTESELIRELKKQYDIVEIDPANPIETDVDVMLAVQPSTLGVQQMEHFVNAVKSGIPTAILEDPLPVMFDVPGTAQPKRPQANMFGMSEPQEPKGDINALWSALGVSMVDGGSSVIWQDYNPEPKAQVIVKPEFIFIDEGNQAYEAFNNENPISSGMRQILLLFAGGWNKEARSKLEYAELASTGKRTGTVGAMEAGANIQYLNVNGYLYDQSMMYSRVQRRKEYKPAVYVHGKRPLDDVSLSELEQELDEAGETETSTGGDANAGTAENGTIEDAVPTAPDQPEINAVLVADIDWVAPSIFRLREIGNSEEFEVNWKFQNVTFLLNMLDFLAGEDDFIEIRKRERTHRLLTLIEEETSVLRESSLRQESDFIREVTERIDAKQREFEEEFAKKREQWAELSPTDRRTRERQFEEKARRELNAAIVSMQRDRDKQIEQIHRDLELKIDEIQDKYKAWALVVPPVPPLLVAFFVFFHRRRGEQEGVARSRLR